MKPTRDSRPDQNSETFPKILSFMVVALLMAPVLLLPGPPAAVASRNAIQTTATLDPVADAAIDSTLPDDPQGLEPSLHLFHLGQNETGRVLLRFNLAAAVPAEAIIDSATLALYLESGRADRPIQIAATNVAADWTESEVTWNTQPVTGTASAANVVSSSPGLKYFDVTSVVQAWHNVPHYGLVLTGMEASTVYDCVFAGRLAAANQPLLEVTYHLPNSSEYSFSGHVYQSSPYESDRPLAGTTVKLYGAGDDSPENGPGLLLDTAASDEAGAFELQWAGETFPYYHLIRFGPPNTYPTGATAELPDASTTARAVTFPDPGSGDYGGVIFYSAERPEDCRELLVNGDFETGALEPWGSDGVVGLGSGREGGSGAWFGGEIDTMGELWQGVTIPAEAESVVMSFWWKAEASIEKPGDALKIVMQEGEEAENLLWLPADGELGSWQYAALDLGAFAGKQVGVTFHVHTFGDAPTTFGVDDVQVAACGGFLPGLVVTDFWPEGNRICYQLQNLGDYASEGGHSTTLDRVGSGRLSEDWVDEPLEPGERWGSCFDHDFTCAGTTDTLMVSTDAGEAVPEWDNANNAREESWRCDETPPVLVSGPAVTGISSDSAVVQWQTDEYADSQVFYGVGEREYDLESYDESLVISHTVSLSNLTPNTVYRFMVTSADEGGNRSAGDVGVFQTLPEDDGEDPGVALRDPGVWQDAVTVVADVTDNRGVEKVAFCLQSTASGAVSGQETAVRSPAPAHDDDFCLLGELLLIDYSPPYEVVIDTTEYENGDYRVSAEVYDFSERSDSDQMDAQFANPIDPDAPVVVITSPTEGQAVSGTVPVIAEITDNGKLAFVYFWVNGEFGEFVPLPGNPKSITLTFNWDTTVVTRTNTVLAVQALDTMFNEGLATRKVTVGQPSPPSQPKLTLTGHTVTRQGNAIEVALTVSNVGQGTAENVEIVDTLRSFQPISRDVTSPHAISFEANYLETPKLWYSTIIDTADLIAGASRTYTYTAIPVLLYPNQPSPAVGESVYLYYQDTAGKELSDQVNYPVSLTAGGQSIGDAWASALKEATYLLVTNPQRLSWYHSNSQPVDDLLSAMAELAYHKDGALGYLYVHDRATLDSLIEPFTYSSWTKYGDNWSIRLHSNFLKLLTGALLIVGETEIIPAWEQGGFTIGWGTVYYSDQPYADIGGSLAPELLVGRIVGDDATTMIKPIQASIGVHTGDPNYAFDQLAALAVSGAGLGSFVQDVDDVSTILHNEGYLVAKVHTKDYYQIGSFAASYDSTGDDFAVGDFLATNTDGEVVIYDDSLDSVYVYDKTGATLASFAVGSGSNDPNDGDQIEIANGHVVMADAGADRILVYDGSGTQLSSFAVTFDAHDVLAVGDLTGGSAEEIVVADHSANLVRIYSEAGVNSGLTVPHTFDPFDLLAVGDVLGNALDEVVVGDRSTGEILIYSAAGVLQGSLQLPTKVVNSTTTLTTLEYYDYDLTTNQNVGGSALAIGQLYPYPSGSDSGKKEILLAPARNWDHLFPFWWNASESKLRNAQPVPWNFDEYEGLAIGEMGAYLTTTQDEILVADDAGYVRLFDTSNWLSRWRTAIPIYTQDSDVILLDGHGNVDGCCGLSSYGGNVFPLDFNGHNPVVLGTSCLTGNYQDNNDKLNFPDRVLDSGAAVYIGSTANSSGYQNREAAKWLYDNWNYGESIGKVFTELERSYWTGVGTDDWWFWAYEHNLYGDPRFAAATGTTALSAGIQLADSVLDIEVPDYTVTRNNGLDWVEIPGGRLWSEPGELWLPYYAASVDVPAGQRVQTVELIDRGEPITGTGILLPMVPVTPTTGACTPEPYSGPVDDWYPPQLYDWDVLHNADGSSTLALTLFPFYYNPLTTDVQFFQHYSFEVVTETVEVDIDALATDRAQYELGGLVNIDVGVVNGGEGQDLIVSAVIRQAGAQETVAGLPLVMLDDLRGPAALSLQWDSSGVEPGNYIVEVTLQSAGSVQVLDLETQIFGLGITGGAITGFAAGPRKFEIGDQISLSLTFENTGTVAIDGAAVFEVWDEAGGTVAEFRRDISDLNPGAPITIEEVWETSAAVDETYLVMAYVSYGSTTTRPVTAQVSTNAFIYLPLTLRGG